MEEINLYELLRFYAKKWLTIIIVTMIGATLGILYTYYFQTPLYESKATLLTVGVQRVGGNQDSVVLNNYVSLFKSHRVLDSVIESKQYTGSYDDLVRNTSAENGKNSDIINVSILAKSPQLSKQILEKAIESFQIQTKNLYGETNVSIKVIDTASTAQEPENIKPIVQIGLTSLLGLAAAMTALFFVYDYNASIASKRKPSKVPQGKATRKKSTTKRKTTE